jgi:hypothetical protein
MMSWRPMRPADLKQCLSINPKGMGHELVGRERAVAASQWLTKTRSFQAVVIESDAPIKGHRIVGFCASVFVSAEFAGRETSDPKPGLTARVISSIVAGQAVVLTAKELGYANAQGCLHLVILQPSSMPGALDREQRQDVLRQASLATLYCHDGYQVRRVLMEATSHAEIEFTKSFSIWRVHSTFEDFHQHDSGNSWNRDRALFTIDFADGLSFVVKGGHHREPVLRLRISDQELLAAALRVSTDRELSHELGLKLSALKKRWASVFNRVAIAKPDLLPGLDDNLDHSARGPQKRHRLLAYVREHPEELRPFLHPQTQRRPSSPSSSSFSSTGKRNSTIRNI